VERCDQGAPRGRLGETDRLSHANRYVELASKVESDLGLDKARIDAAYLGNIDTFRFEERSLLAFAGELIAKREYAKALGIVTGCNRSFWVDLDVAPAGPVGSLSPDGLPGESASFSVIEHQGKLAASIEGAAMPGLNERLKKMGSFEYYQTSFSYQINETGEEQFVGVPERGGKDFISPDPLAPGTI